MTLPYVEAIADHGLARRVAADPALAQGRQRARGKITYEAVAEAHGLDVHAARATRSRSSRPHGSVCGSGFAAAALRFALAIRARS